MKILLFTFSKDHPKIFNVIGIQICDAVLGFGVTYNDEYKDHLGTIGFHMHYV